jgi:hypothetical protein
LYDSAAIAEQASRGSGYVATCRKQEFIICDTNKAKQEKSHMYHWFITEKVPAVVVN